MLRKDKKGRFTALLLAALMLLNTGLPAALAADGDEYYEPGYIDGDKTAECIDEEAGIYEITLKLEGEPTRHSDEKILGADVVLVLDLSGSMNAQRWGKTKDAAEVLLQMLLEDGSTDNRVAVVGYGSTENTPENLAAGYAAHSTIVDFTSDPDAARGWWMSAETTNYVRQMTGIPRSETNGHAGLIGAREVFQTVSGDLDRAKFIIYLTDGAINRHYIHYNNRYDWEESDGSGYVQAAANAAVAEADALKADGVTIFSVPTFTAQDAEHNQIVNFMQRVATDPDKTYFEADVDNIEDRFREIVEYLFTLIDVTVEHTNTTLVDNMSMYVDFDEAFGVEAQRSLRGMDDWQTGTTDEVGTVVYDPVEKCLTWEMDQFDSDYEYRIVYRIQIKEEYANELLHDDQTSGLNPTSDDPTGVIANGYTYITSDILDEEEINVPTVYRSRGLSVTYHYNYENSPGVYYREEDVEARTTVNPPEDPTRPGFLFDGWYLEAACQNAYDFSTPVLDDLDLYADWVVDDDYVYTVNYHANNGGSAVHTETVYGLLSHTVLSNSTTGFAYPGFVFTGWSEDENATEADIQPGTTIHPAAYSTTDLYAVWEVDDGYIYTVNYHANNGGSAVHTEEVYALLSHMVLGNDTTGFTYPGFKFTGWSEDAKATEADIQPGTTIHPAAYSTTDLYAVWEIDDDYIYTVNYHANNGGDDVHTERVYGLLSHTVLGNDTTGFTYPGFVFTGWSEDEKATEADIQPGTTIHPAAYSTTDLYAVWEVDDGYIYTVNYHANNGGNDIHTERVYGLLSHSVLDNDTTGFSYPGFKFAGWSEDETATTADVLPGTEIHPAAYSTTDLYAVWEIDDDYVYTVNYHSNNGQGETHRVTVYALGAHSVLGNDTTGFSYPGFIFTGWSEEENAAAADVLPGMSIHPAPYSTTDLYAVWEIDDDYIYTVNYHSNNGQNGIYTETVYALLSHTVLGNDTTGFSNPGYVFTGWSENRNATSADIQPGTAIHPAAYSTTDLYAVWAVDNDYIYTVNYHANNGQNTVHSVKVYALGAHAVLDNSATGFSYPGYTFAGWSEDRNAATADVLPGTTIHPAAYSTTDLYAVWEVDDDYIYTVVYHANNGQDVTYSVSVYALNAHQLVSDETAGFTYDGHRFTGWSLDRGASAADLQPGATLHPAAYSTTHLYAVWERSEYTVTFHWNNEDVEEDIYLTTTAQAGSTVPVPAEPELRYYDFIAWYLEADCLRAYDFSTPVTGDLDLYADWDYNFVPAMSPDHFAYLVGYEDNTVRPGASITRSEVASVFMRVIEDEDRDWFWSTTNDFIDVETGDWFNNAVSTMTNAKLFKGYDTGEFKPGAAITRAEFATVAARFLEVDTYEGESKFTDIAGHWAEKEINIAAEHGWLSGYNDGTFLPDDPISRAEVAIIINRMRECQVYDVEDLLPDMITWPDNMDTSEWYYFAIQEATNSHYYEIDEDDPGHEIWTSLRENRDWTILQSPDATYDMIYR